MTVKWNIHFPKTLPKMKINVPFLSRIRFWNLLCIERKYGQVVPTVGKNFNFSIDLRSYLKKCWIIFFSIKSSIGFNLILRNFIFKKILIWQSMLQSHKYAILHNIQMISNMILKWWQCLTLSAQVEAVSAAPSSTTWATNGLSVSVSFAKTTWALSRRCKTAQFTMFLDSFADPVNLWITTDCVVGWINKNHFKIFVWWILGNPVWVQNSQSTETATDTFLFMIKKQKRSRKKTNFFSKLVDHCRGQWYGWKLFKQRING